MPQAYKVGSSEPRLASRADRAACAHLIRGGSRSFYAASLLLPRRMREGAYALYAFCRLSDDAVDEPDEPAAACAAIARLRLRLDRIYEGRPLNSPVDRALADTVRAHFIPRACFDALIEGLEWDVAGRRYETLSEVRDYAARVAGSVGAMMAALMGVREVDLIARACDLGVAMQLTNIARDVGTDARMGRLYLPRAWVAEAGVDPDAWLADPAPSPEISAVTERLLAAADALYERATPGVAALPLAYRPAIAAASRIYRAIGGEVRRNGGDSVSRRAFVSGAGKRRLAIEAFAWSLTATSFGAAAPALPETRFLVAALSSAMPPRSSFFARIDRRVGGVFDLFRELDARSRAGSPLFRTSAP